MHNKNCDLETAYANCKMKLQELRLKYEEFKNNTYYLDLEAIALNFKIIKILEDILQCKDRIIQRKMILNYINKDAENIALSDDADKTFYLAAQRKLKNDLINDIQLSQKEKEEKNTSNLNQEIVELDAELGSFEWDYKELESKFINLQFLINNFKITIDKIPFENKKK